jgi:hypothetical protein
MHASCYLPYKPGYRLSIIQYELDKGGKTATGMDNFEHRLHADLAPGDRLVKWRLGFVGKTFNLSPKFPPLGGVSSSFSQNLEIG